MIKIHFLDGYKYIGDHPDRTPGEPSRYGIFRDNLTYCCFEVTNWLKDQSSILFLIKNHVNWINRDENDAYLHEFIGTYVVNNKTPKLYLIVKQHDVETLGNITIAIMNEATDKHTQLLKIIKAKKQFYIDLEEKKQRIRDSWNKLKKKKD